MTQYGIVTDLNRCVGCMACNTACKTVNAVPIGSFWNKVLRVGPNPKYEGAKFPDIEWYYLPVQCQHCANPACVNVCPTEASHKLDDGTVQVDKEKCIGCQFCAMACPYNVRYLNEEERVVEKCTLCEQQTAQGVLPQCVSQCVGLAKWFGDLDQADWSDFRGGGNFLFGDAVRDYAESDVHHLPDVGNSPSFAYILRNKAWQGEG
ncbi:4Fe-4S dicluster domain-containing protein [Parvibacter caecicola]|uniref:4Fe-4S dicluster domain-containing protein n=1 Tax=Parvibacter caecicola TaxID=747645 RepID=UPI00248C704E|nr:4Fe-4S dicluster domain-containing protein [Parvibacter caecicola]